MRVARLPEKPSVSANRQGNERCGGSENGGFDGDFPRLVADGCPFGFALDGFLASIHIARTARGEDYSGLPHLLEIPQESNEKGHK